MIKKYICFTLTLTALIFGFELLSSPVDAMELVIRNENIVHKKNDREIELKPRLIPIFQDKSPLSKTSKNTEIDPLDLKTAVIIEYMQVINALLKYKKALGWDNSAFTYFIHEEQDKVFDVLDKHHVFMNKYEDYKINKIYLFYKLDMPIRNKRTISELLDDKDKKNIFQERLKKLGKDKETVKKLAKKMILDLNEQYAEYRVEYSNFSLKNQEVYANLSKEYSDYHRDYSKLLKDAKEEDFIFEKYYPDINQNYDFYTNKNHDEFSDKYSKLNAQGLKNYYQFLKLKSTQQKYEKVRNAVEHYNKMFPGLENSPFEEADKGCFSFVSCIGYCCFGQ